MRDEEWAERLRGRVDDVVPDVPVDVAGAMRQGRRRRTARAVTSGAVGLAVVAGAVVAAPTVAGLVDPTPPAVGEETEAPSRPGDAEILDAVPDCFDSEVTAALFDLPLDPPSRPGAVPEGFVPVAVVECKVIHAEPLPDFSEVPAPEVRSTIRGAPLGGAAAAPTEEMSAFTEALGLPPETWPASGGCLMFGVIRMEFVYLVDAYGRAVLAEWPMDACGHYPLPEVTAAYEALPIVTASTSPALVDDPQQDAATGEAGILDAVPDCFAPALRDEYGNRRPPPRPGAVPDGFTAVAVLECGRRSAAILGGPIGDRDAEPSSEVRAFVEALALPSGDRFPEDGCLVPPAQSSNSVFLVDARGRAVLPAWPRTECARDVRPEVVDAYEALPVIETIPAP